MQQRRMSKARGGWGGGLSVSGVFKMWLVVVVNAQSPTVTV
jgi:hypothetical protein